MLNQLVAIAKNDSIPIATNAGLAEHHLPCCDIAPIINVVAELEFAFAEKALGLETRFNLI